MILEMGVPDASVFWLALAAAIAMTLAAPDHFDQRQTGEYNVRIQLKELKIVAVAMSDGDEDGDYDQGNYDYEDPVDPMEQHTKSTTPKTTTSSISSASTSSVPSAAPNAEPNVESLGLVDTQSTTDSTNTSTTTSESISTETPSAEPVNDPLDPVNTKPTTSKTPMRTKTTSTTAASIPSSSNVEQNIYPLSTESTLKPLGIKSSTVDSLTTTTPKNVSNFPTTGDKPATLNVSEVSAFWNDITSFNDVVTTVDGVDTKLPADFSTELTTETESSTPLVSVNTEATTPRRVNNKYDPTKRIRARVRCRPGYSKDRNGLCRKIRVTPRPVAAVLSQ